MRIGRESYENFTRTMLDLFWAPGLTRPGGEKYMEVKGLENLDALAGEADGGARGALRGIRVGEHRVRAAGVPRVHAVAGVQESAAGQTFTDLRTCTGQEIITQEMSMLRMLRQVKKGKLVGMLIDLNLPPTQAATVIETFGMKMCSTYLHAVLAQRDGGRAGADDE